MAVIWAFLREKWKRSDAVACIWIGLVVVIRYQTGMISSMINPNLGAIAFWFSGFSSFILVGYLTAVIFSLS
jgi:hypothetical protein